jgi:hypothetical protein
MFVKEIVRLNEFSLHEKDNVHNKDESIVGEEDNVVVV